MVPFEAILDTN
jgi:hypothetical protein